MIIYHLSAGIGGGAGSSAFRLHRDLMTSGLDSRFLSWDLPQKEMAMSNPVHGSGWLSRLGRMGRRFKVQRRLQKDLSRIRKLSEPFSLDETELVPDVSHALPPKCDLIHLHWVAEFIDYSRFFSEVKRRCIPVIWTLWDMNPFTGGCHFDLGCGRYKGKCGCCPILQSENDNDLSRDILLQKERALKNFPSQQLHLAAPCHWMGSKAEESHLFRRFTRHVIHTGTDVELFVSMSQEACRATLKIEGDIPTILFISDTATNERKGSIYLLEALRLLQNRGIHARLLVVGAGTVKTDSITTVQLGRISERRKLPIVYNAADIYVCPSLQDNLPNTLLEAMSCGIPPIAFDCGGIPELIQHGANGLLAETRNAGQLADHLSDLLGNPERRRRMGLEAAQTVRNSFPMSMQVNAYRELYQRVVETKF